MPADERLGLPDRAYHAQGPVDAASDGVGSDPRAWLELRREMPKAPTPSDAVDAVQLCVRERSSDDVGRPVRRRPANRLRRRCPTLSRRPVALTASVEIARQANASAGRGRSRGRCGFLTGVGPGIGSRPLTMAALPKRP